MVSHKLSQTYKQNHCSILVFFMKPDTINIIISGLTEFPL